MDAQTRDTMEKKLSETLKVAPAPIADDQLLAQIRGWDSVRFMRFLMALEKEWKIRFEAHEVANLKKWGELVSLVQIKRN